MSDPNAIDGKRKSARNFREGNMGRTVYTPSEKPIRSDVEEILSKSYSNFETWYSQRKEAVEEELGKYEVIADIPNLQYGSEGQKYDLTANTHFSQHLKVLQRAKKFLEIIKDKWEERHNRTIVS